MKRIKPKWLLGMTLAIALVVGCSIVTQAAAPSFTGSGITSPTGASPEYRQPGATFTVTFDYSSDPVTVPRWTKALVQLLDGATLIKEIEETIPSVGDAGYTGTASIGMIIPPPPLPGLTEGLYDVQVFLSNSDGGGWTVSDTELGAVIIDQTPPSAPGVPSTATPTTNTTPDWTWTAATDPTILSGATPGSGIKGYWVKIGTTAGGSETLTDTWVGSGLPWTVDLDPVTVGNQGFTTDDTYYLSVRAEDNVGNLGPWVTGSVLVDTTNPNAPTGLTVTTPTNDRTPLVTWTAATDPGYPDSGSGIVNYQVQIGTSTGAGDKKVWTSVGNITTFDDAAWAALLVTLAPDDDYFFQVRSVDAVGHTSAGAEVQISVDATAPTDPGSLNSDEDPTADTTIEWSWTASTDPDPGVGLYFSGISGYYVKLGTTSGGDEVVTETGIGNVTNYTTPDLTANGSGTYYLSVRAKDAAGNYSNWVTHSAILDITAPGAPGVPSGTSPTTDTTPPWSWTAASDAHTPIASYNVKIGTTQGGSDVLGVTNIGNFLSYAPAGPLANDRYYLSVQAVDTVGNVSAWSEDPSGILIDTVNPNAPTGLTVTTPTNDSTPLVTWTAATDPGYPDSGSGIAGYNVQIGTTSGGTQVIGPTAVGNITTFDDAKWTALGVTLAPDGTYYFQVQSIDNVALTSGWAEVAIVVETARPALSNGSPTGYIATDTPTISADFTDTGLGLDASATTLTLTHAGSPTVITAGFTGVPSYGDGLLATTIQYTPVPPGLEDGAWMVDMVAYDLAGNKTLPDPTLQWTFNIDTTPPTDPGSPVAGNLGDDGNWYINTLRPTFSWTASEDPDAPDGTPGSGLRDYSFQFGTEATKPGSGTDLWGGALVDVTGIPPTPVAGVQQWTPTADLPLAAGTEYSGRVKAFDNLGNATPWIDPLIIYDPDPPTAPGTPTTTSPTNDATPTWSWTGSTDDISGVDLYHIQIRHAGSADWDVLDMQLDIPDALTPGDETWVQGLQLESGDYEIRVRAMDVAGNHSDWSGTGSVTIDLIPPAVPGMPQTASPTNDATPTWTWGAVADAASYNVYLDEAFMGNQAGTSYTPGSDLPDGQHYLQVSSVDALGNESGLSEAGYVVIDTTDPAAPEMMQVPEYTKDDSVAFIWSAVTDAVKYDFSYSVDGGATWTTVTDLTVQTYTVDISSASDGDEICGKVVAWDAAGNDSAESNVESTIVDTTGPVVTPVAPVAPVTIADATPTWEWSGTDAGCGVAGYWVTLDDDLTVWTTDDWFTPASALEDGEHYVVVVGVDELGNEGDPLEFATVTTDTTPPAVPGMPQTASPTNDATPTWTWGAVADAASYNVYLDEAFMGNQAGTSYTPGSDLPDGQHYLQVSSLDALGNESGLSEAGYVMIDTTDPAAPEMMPQPEYTKDDSVTFIWSAVTDAVKYDFSYSLDGGDNWTTVTDLTVQTYTVDISGASDGDEICGKVVAWDAAGNDSAESNVESTIVDRTGPVVTAVTPGAPATTNDPTPRWEWSGTDAGCGVAGYWVTLDDDLTVWTTDDWFTPASALEDGEHYVVVVGVDELGNESDEPLVFSVVTIDATKPAKPNAPVAEENPTADATPKWTWNAVTDEHGPVTYDVYLDGEFQDSTTETEWTVPDEDALADGQHYLQVTAEDTLNNTSEISELGYVVVDTTAPSKVVGLCQHDTEPEPSIYVPRFEWNSASDACTGVSRYDLRYRPVGGSWTMVDVGSCIGWTALSPWTDGTYDIQVRAIDAVGNEGEWSDTLTITIDTTPPSVVFINPTEIEGVTYDITTSSTIIAEIDGEFDQHKVWLSIDGGGEVTPTAIVGRTVYYVVGVPFTADEHTVAIRVQDAAGNEGSATVTFTVEAYRQGFGFGRLRFDNTEESGD